MRQTTMPARRSWAPAAAPFAVLGTLAASLTATPAAADDVKPLRTVDLRVLDTPAKTIATAAVATAVRPANYTVRSGDTISGIAAQFGLTTADVLSWNGLGWRTTIYPGQKVSLQAAGAAAAPVAPTTTTPTVTPVTTGAVHTVVRGDSVWGIANRYGSSVSGILTANKLGSSALIFPGQKLTIPGTQAAAPAQTPAAEAPVVETPVVTTPVVETPIAPVVETVTPPASTAATVHTVRAGDSPWAIANKYGTSVTALLAANRLTSGSIIYPGQTLAIPGVGTPAAASPAVVVPTPPASAGAQKSAVLDSEQIANAQLIIAIGRELGVPDRGITIALAAAMVESWIRNLDYGDRDSLGIFQQRPSYGWGTADQVRDPEHAIRAFYGGATNPNYGLTRGLLDIPGWQSMTVSEAAQAVQISAYPDRYGQWEVSAALWLALYG